MPDWTTQGRTHRALAIVVLCAVPLLAPAQTYQDSRCRLVGSQAVAVGGNPFAVAAADVDGDGKVDIASADEAGNSISILRSDGPGHFLPAVAMATATAPRDVVLADVSGDGKPDVLAVASGANLLQVWIGSGSGTFAAPTGFATGNSPQALAIGDVNLDGKPDVAVAEAGANQVSVFLGTGSGAFAARVSFTVGAAPVAVAMADLNADGKPDLAVANEVGNSLSVLAGTGTGSFGSALTLAVGAQPKDLVVADLTGDDKPDLLTANWNGSSLSLLPGTGNGGFGTATTIAVATLPVALTVADLESDGELDVVVAHESSFPNQLSFLRGLPGGGLSAPNTQLVAGTRPRALVAADVDDDGAPDVAFAAYSANQVSTLVSDCAPAMNLAPRADADLGSSHALRNSPLWLDRSRPGAYTHVMTHQDLDRDGDVDLVRASIVANTTTDIEVFRNDAGVFSDQTAWLVPAPHPVVTYPRKGLNGDFNDDGWPDVILLDTGFDVFPPPGAINQLYLSRGDGTLQFSPALGERLGFFHAGATADIDGNGTVDLLVTEGTTGAWFMINDGLGHFTLDRARLPLESFTSYGLDVAEMFDLDLDGYVDLITAGKEFTAQDPPVIIYWGGADGLYRESRRTQIPKPAGNGGTLDIVAGDIDHDGDRDLVVNRFPDGFATGRYLQILRQTAPRTFVDETASRITMNHGLSAFDFLRIQDINGDGHPDLLVDDRRFVLEGEAAWTNDGNGHFSPYSGPVNPTLPYTTLDIADVATLEGQAGAKQLVFQVRLNRPATAPVVFDVATGAGTATAGVDYTAKSANGVVIGVGQSSASFSVTINGDASVEPDEAFSVVLSNVSGAKVLRGRGYGFIDNDDEYLLSVNDLALAEGNAGQTQASFTISLSSPSPSPVSFDVFTAPGTASPGIDYVSSSQVGKTIAAGQTIAEFAVPVAGDTVVEGNETFTVNLANSVGARLLDAQGQGRIVNDDLAQLSISDASVVEGNAGQSTLVFFVNLSRALPNPVNFDIATSNGTATAGSDYVARALTGRFLDAGRTRWRFEVQVNGDATAEANETFGATLSNVSGAMLTDAAAVGTVTNDDAAVQPLRNGKAWRRKQ